MEKQRLHVGMEVIVIDQGRGDRATTVTHVGRRWATLELERVKFDVVTWANNIGYSYPVLSTPTEQAEAKRYNNIAARLLRCGVRVESTKYHPDIDALERMAAIAEAGMPGARRAAMAAGEKAHCRAHLEFRSDCPGCAMEDA